MILIDKVHEALQAMRNAQLLDNFVFCTPQKANVLIGGLKAGNVWAVHIVPKVVAMHVSGQMYNYTADMTLYFLTSQDKLDFDATQNMTKQDKCMAYTVDFLARLRADKAVRVVSENIQTAIMYSVNDRTCCGVKLSFNLETIQPQCLSEVDSEVSVSATLSNPTTSTINVKINYEVGVRELVSKGFLWGLNAEEQTNEVVMAGDEYTLEGLDSDAMYFVKPFVTTDKATTYGEVVSGRTKAVPLILLTSAVSGIDENTATLNGSVIGDVVECGFVYATHDEPTIDDTKVVCEVVASEIQTIVSGLTENTLYYVRVYAIVNGVAQYGDEENFTTQLINPLLVTDPATNITADSFIANGLIFDYNRPLLDMGIVYGSAQYPVIGVGDAVKVTVDELDNYRLKKVVDNIESETDLYYRTFGTKQNNLTLYSLNSEKCYNSIPCEFYDWVRPQVNSDTAVNMNIKFHHDKYVWMKNYKIPSWNACWGLYYNNKSIFGDAYYNYQSYYKTDGTRYTNGGPSVVYELLNGRIYVNNTYQADCTTTHADYLVENGVIEFKSIVRENRFYGLINADKKNDDGTYENLYAYLRPCQLIVNIPASKTFDNVARTVGSNGLFDMATGKFWYLANAIVGND